MSIKLPTVLILGAGASHPYGFPLGVELRDLICEQTTDIRFTAPLRQLGFEPDATKEFGQALQHSGFGSVDAFLETSPEFAAIGKTAIALTLLPLEQRAKLFPPKAPKNGHWYQYLLGLMGVGTDDWAANRLTILTFDYDRSFEHYFCTVLARRLKVSRLEAAKTFHIIDVIHLHGQLGTYPGLGSKPFGYGDGDLSLDDIARAATSIRTISEPSDLEVFVEAGKRISAARRVFFLGFGFADASMARLVSHTPTLTALLGATSKGITDREWARITKLHFKDRWSGKRFRRSVLEFLRSEVDLTYDPAPSP